MSCEPPRIGPYIIGKQIGSGSFSKVRVGTDPQGCKWAIKIIDKVRLRKENMEDQMLREVAIMKRLKQRNIVKLHDVLQSQHHYYLVLEYLDGGELFDKILDAKKMDEPTARQYFHQLISGIHYCHTHSFAHRDLKPENLLLDRKGVLKITDFGLSNIQQDFLLNTVCGTPNYVAPEILMERGYNGLTADIWSCGVILYVMLSGRLPFEDKNVSVLLAKIENGDYKLAKSFSEPVKNLISRMLTVDPTKRITLEGIMEHPWFQVDWDPKMLSMQE